jgi:hypothetical protein
MFGSIVRPLVLVCSTTMSLSSTSTLKTQLKTHLGPKADLYFSTLNLFVTGQTSRTEFDDSIRAILDAPNLGVPVSVLVNTPLKRMQSSCIMHS